MTELHRILGDSGFEISMAGSGLRVRVARACPVSERAAWVECARAVARSIFAALGCPVCEDPGIRFVTPEVHPADSGDCQVCGERLESDRVACARCATPHHAECWKYAGGCSTFAGGGQECRSGTT